MGLKKMLLCILKATPIRGKGFTGEGFDVNMREKPNGITAFIKSIYSILMGRVATQVYGLLLERGKKI